MLLASLRWKPLLSWGFGTRRHGGFRKCYKWLVRMRDRLGGTSVYR